MHSTAKRNVLASQRHQFFPAFDYLRAFSALGVFVSHADKYQLLPPDLGNACVQVFFALSGFLIGGILLKSQASDLPRFFFNRAVRIWTPYAISIAILFVATAIKQGLADPKIGEFFFYMVTFDYNWFGPPQLAQFVHRMPLDGTGNYMWSICVEEQFYLIAPFALLFLSRSVSAMILVGLLALNFVSPHYFASIALGVLLALTNRDWRVVGATALASVAAFTFFQYPMWMPLVAVTIVGLAARSGSQSRIGKILGGASYPFYLNHWIGLFVMSAVIKFGAPYAIAWIVGLTVATAISVIHYFLIDLWIATNRARFFTKELGIAAGVTGWLLVSAGAVGGLFLF
jgi:peptidoglycan/LPS O-acetylase OafA/YrhL